MLVLHIDPDRDATAVLEALLAFHGVRVVSTSSLEDGLRLAEDLRPDVVVTEYDPAAPGRASVLEALRGSAHAAQVPVLVWTAHAFPEIRAEVEAARGIFLPKPATPTEVLDKLRRIAGSPSRAASIPACPEAARS